MEYRQLIENDDYDDDEVPYDENHSDGLRRADEEFNL
jgi:hypothetical protein